LGYISDGLSNQLLVGEKYVPDWALNKNTRAARSWDGGWLGAGDGPNGDLNEVYGIARKIASEDCGHAPFAKGGNSWSTDVNLPEVPTDRACWESGWCGTSRAWGSTHMNVANFLVGDGTVRSISYSINIHTFFLLGHTSDGKSAALP
jgi:hypothetical protein